MEKVKEKKKMLDYLEVEKVTCAEDINDYLKKYQIRRKKFGYAYFKLEDEHTQNASFYRVYGQEAQNGYLCVYDPFLRSYLFYGEELAQYTRTEAAQKIYKIILRDYQ